jgi:alpha-1,3-rhamnosyl/mannosyltransferase
VRSSSRIVAISESTKRDLSRFFAGSRGKTTVVPLATDERFRPVGGSPLQEALHRLRLPKRYILYMGINKPHKNLAFLLRVFAKVGTDAKLVLAGKEDPRYSQAREEAKRLGLEDRVVFLGDIDDSDLPMLYSGVELFVFPSLYEGFGLPVLEAMACGTPVVCSGASSLPEIVGDAAVTLDPEDEAAWAATIAELLENEDFRRELSKKGLKRAGQFSWEDTARETVGIYRSVLSR